MVLPLPHLHDSSAYVCLGHGVSSRREEKEGRQTGARIGRCAFGPSCLSVVCVPCSSVCPVGARRMLLARPSRVFLGAFSRIDSAADADAHVSLSFLWHACSKT